MSQIITTVRIKLYPLSVHIDVRLPANINDYIIKCQPL